MASSSNNTDGDFGFQIAPMVDIVFVLLLFFMACAGMRQIEGHLSLNLPGGIPDRMEPPIIIDIATDGAVSIGGQVLAASDDESLTRLRAWFDSLLSDEIANAPVVIRPTADAQHGRFVQILSIINHKGFKKISFA